MTAREHLDRHVRRGASDECWPWVGPLAPNGYGKVLFEGQTMGAHRLAYQVAKGTIPPGLVVRHACDNPPCCNPAHLLLGTPADNSRDMVRRGRSNKRPGSKHHMALLTEAKVREIRSSYAAGGVTYADLGERYGVSRFCVKSVVKRTRWAHVA